MSRTLAQIVCAVFGVVMFLLFFSSHPTARAITLTITTEYWQVIYAFALIVGTISFVKVNVINIQRGQDTLYRAVSLIGLVAMPLVAIIWGISANTPFMWIFENVQVPMQSTVFALLAFFVASASFRGFRARSLPAAVLLLSAVLILLSRTWAEGEFAGSLISVADWVRSYPSMAARRAILIGIGLGSLTTSLRVIVGIERTWLGGGR
jgi:FlaA1/EpsC-like NDP-sugar epimerase